MFYFFFFVGNVYKHSEFVLCIEVKILLHLNFATTHYCKLSVTFFIVTPLIRSKPTMSACMMYKADVRTIVLTNSIYIFWFSTKLPEKMSNFKICDNRAAVLPGCSAHTWFRNECYWHRHFQTMIFKHSRFYWACALNLLWNQIKWNSIGCPLTISFKILSMSEPKLSHIRDH
jgi:hypothetical protein